MKNKNKEENVSKKLDEIETEMKNINCWSNNPPKFEFTSYSDAPSFELWLQCVLLPNARKAVITGEYPKKSQVGLMAMKQYNYHTFADKAQTLLKLLYEFDEIINSK